MLAPDDYHGLLSCAAQKAIVVSDLLPSQTPIKSLKGIGIAEIDTEGRFIRWILVI